MLTSDQYPEAFRIYRSHCQSYLSDPRNETAANKQNQGARTIRLPEGTTLLIPPQEKDYSLRGGAAKVKKQWIACLFTSWHYGPRKRSPPDVILANTELAVADLRRQIAEIKSNVRADADPQTALPGELWGCRFNAGLFAVEWEKTRTVLEDAELSMTIVKLAGE